MTGAGAQGSLDAAAGWVLGLLGGPMTTAILTLAIAGIGFAMLSGRLMLRRAGTTIVGGFIMLGASSIAAALLHWNGGTAPMSRRDSEIFKPTVELKTATKVVVPDNYDPYAGAAVMPQRPAN